MRSEDLVIATIIRDQGATPRTAGTRMAIRRNREFMGTIGGGLLEAKVQQIAAVVFEKKMSSVQMFDMTQNQLNETHMICGGKLEFLLEYLPAEPHTAEFYKMIQKILENRQKGMLVINLGSLKNVTNPIERFLILSDGSLYGREPGDDKAEKIKARTRNLNEAQLVEVENCFFWAEPLSPSSILYIFGAGHVARPTAKIGIQLGFRTLVFDDRREFANSDRFPFPIETKVLPDFNRCFSGLTVNPDAYVVIVTRGHLHDKTVLAQALKTDAAYIGMIGSHRKRDMIYDALLAEGFTQKDIDRVNSPIGLNIGADTPEEIAVSIMAELIQHRSNKRGTWKKR
jgi:xanthine dehydrogenase accessory factor